MNYSFVFCNSVEHFELLQCLWFNETKKPTSLVPHEAINIIDIETNGYDDKNTGYHVCKRNKRKPYVYC